MAHLKGDKGKITYTPANGNELILATTESWSCTISKELTEVTRQGEVERTYIPSFVTATGSAVVVYDDNASSNTANDSFDAIMELAVSKSSLGTADFQFYPERDTQKMIKFKGYVTGVDAAATTDELQKVTINFQSNGAVTQTI